MRIDIDTYVDIDEDELVGQIVEEMDFAEIVDQVAEHVVDDDDLLDRVMEELDMDMVTDGLTQAAKSEVANRVLTNEDFQTEVAQVVVQLPEFPDKVAKKLANLEYETLRRQLEELRISHDHLMKSVKHLIDGFEAQQNVRPKSLFETIFG